MIEPYRDLPRISHMLEAINNALEYTASFSTFRAVLHTAYRDHKIKENPNGFLDRIDTIPTEKEHTFNNIRYTRKNLYT